MNQQISDTGKLILKNLVCFNVIHATSTINYYCSCPPLVDFVYPDIYIQHSSFSFMALQKLLKGLQIIVFHNILV